MGRVGRVGRVGKTGEIGRMGRTNQTARKSQRLRTRRAASAHPPHPPRQPHPPRPIVAGVGISHPDRLLFPAAGATKVDLARYYESIAEWILPHLVDRPLTLVRCPNGLRPGADPDAECFFMKHSKVWTWPQIRRVRIREKEKVGEYMIADSLTAVAALVQMGVIEIHTWNSRFADVERPDRIVIDLDPGARVAWPAVVAAARLVRQLMSVLDLESFVKTTGGRGLHVVVPLAPEAGWDACLAFARAFA